MLKRDNSLWCKILLTALEQSSFSHVESHEVSLPQSEKPIVRVHGNVIIAIARLLSDLQLHVNMIFDSDKTYILPIFYKLTDRFDLIATPSSSYVTSHERIPDGAHTHTLTRRKSRSSSNSTNRFLNLETSFVCSGDGANFRTEIYYNNFRRKQENACDAIESISRVSRRTYKLSFCCEKIIYCINCI